MFKVANGKLGKIARRPRNAENLEDWEGVRFVFERGNWSYDDVNAVWSAIGLYDLIGPPSGRPGEAAWLRRRAAEYCRTGVLSLAADPGNDGYEPG